VFSPFSFFLRFCSMHAITNITMSGTVWLEKGTWISISN
jgi:hypothetical protein